MDSYKTIREVFALWKKEKQMYVKQSTMATYELHISKHIMPAFGNSSMLHEDDVRAFVEEKTKEGLSQKTVRDIVMILGLLHRYGVKHGLLPVSEWSVRWSQPERGQSLDVFTIKHYRCLMNHCLNNLTNKNIGILICICTGMRIGEICALKWSDIDGETKSIRVNRTLGRIYFSGGGDRRTQIIEGTPKTRNSMREIPMSNKLAKILLPLAKVLNADYYVLTNSDTPIEPHTYRNYYKRLLSKLGLPAVKFHGIRHSFATRCVESKCDYKTLSVILGHSNISTTLNLYVHPDAEQKKKCIDKMLKSLG